MTRRSFRPIRDEAGQWSRGTNEDDAHRRRIGRLQIHRRRRGRARQTALGARIASIAGMFVGLHPRRFGGRVRLLMMARMGGGCFIPVPGMSAMVSMVCMKSISSTDRYRRCERLRYERLRGDRLCIHHLASHRH